MEERGAAFKTQHIGEIRMVRMIKAGLAFTALRALLLQPTLRAQDNMKQDSMNKTT